MKSINKSVLAATTLATPLPACAIEEANLPDKRIQSYLVDSNGNVVMTGSRATTTH